MNPAMSSEMVDLQKEKQKNDLVKSSLSQMASTSKGQTKKLADTIEDNFLVCKMCNETFKNPKCLNCLHSFCEQCLQDHLLKIEQTQPCRYKTFTSSDYRDIQCPLCRKRTALPLGGVRKLPDNFIVNGLTDVIVKQKPGEKIECDVCKASRKSPAGVSRVKCMECCKHLCKDCATFHKTTRVTKHHSLFDLNLEKEVQCSDHPDEVVRFYCETCEKCVCVVCTFQDHQGHDVSSFEDATAKFEDPIRKLAKQCKVKLQASEEALEKLERTENLVRCVEQCVKDKVEEMMADLKIREKQVLEEVRTIYGKDLLNRISQKKEYVMQIENMKNTSKLAEVVLDGKSIEFLLLKKSIEDKLSTIASLDEKLNTLPSTIDKVVEFRPHAFSFGYIYDYDDLDPEREREKKDKIVRKVASVSVATSTENLKTDTEDKKIEKRIKIDDGNSKRVVMKEVESKKKVIDKNEMPQNTKNVEVQTCPMSLDFLISAYKQERKYSPGKDIFYPTNSQKQTSVFDTRPLVRPPPKPVTTKKKSPFVLPEIPSFKALSKSKAENSDVSDFLGKIKNDKNDLNAFKSEMKMWAMKDLKTDTFENKVPKESSVKKEEIIMKQPFPKTDQTTASPAPAVISSPTNTNGSFDLENSTAEATKVSKVVATVAPNVCSVAKPNLQTTATITQVPSENSPSPGLKSTKEKESAAKVSEAPKAAKPTDSTAKHEDVVLRKKLGDRNLTHLSDSPLFRKPKPSLLDSAESKLAKDRKGTSSFSTNPALQLFYQTIGSRQASPYNLPSKTSFNSPYSSQNRTSDGYKFNSYKFH